jgi:cytochrome bd-type quinol oxidase subunit 2
MGILNLLGGRANATGAQGVTNIATFLDNINTPLRTVTIAILALVALGAVGFAIYVAFRLAKAEDEGKRKEAKNQLLWSIIAALAGVVVFILITTVFSTGMLGTNKAAITGGDAAIRSAANEVLGAIFLAFETLFNLLSVAGALFAIYIAIRLATAEDEGKRKQAKAQLLWTLVGIVATIVLITIINAIVFNVLIPEIK